MWALLLHGMLDDVNITAIAIQELLLLLLLLLLMMMT